MARTEGDSWDLVSSVGATATIVAAQRAVGTRSADALINDPFAEPLVSALGVDYFTRYARGEFAEATATEAGVDMRVMNDSMAIRTRYFDDFLLGATAAGIRQVVILASGLDARAYRLAWPAGTTVFEIDQPEVIAFKTTTLADLGAVAPVVHRPLAVDLRDDWPAALRDAGFTPEQPTAWIAEGLLIYLPPAAQDHLFDRITTLSAKGSRLATENVSGISAEQLGQMSEQMRAAREQWRSQGLDVGPEVDVAQLWYVGDRTDSADYLTGAGWKTESVHTSALMASYGLAVPAGELTPFGDPVYVSGRLI
ncbi:MAG: class I SAM-dependent methyltransferase [Mycobacterium sp.]